MVLDPANRDRIAAAVAEDACEGLNTGWPTCDTTVKLNTINGSPTITYNGDMQPAGLGTGASVTKWLGL